MRKVKDIEHSQQSRLAITVIGKLIGITPKVYRDRVGKIDL